MQSTCPNGFIEVYNEEKLQARIDEWMDSTYDDIAGNVDKVDMLPVHNGGAADKSYWTTSLDVDGDGKFDLFPSETYCIDIGHYLYSGTKVCYAMLSSFTEDFPVAFTQSGVNTANWPNNGVASILNPQNFRAANFLAQHQFDIGTDCGVGVISGSRDGANTYRITGGDKQRAFWGLMSAGIRNPGDASSGTSQTLCVESLVSKALAFQANNPTWFPSPTGSVFVVLAPITCTDKKWYPIGQVLIGKLPVSSVGGFDCLGLDAPTTPPTGNGLATTTAPPEPPECPPGQQAVLRCRFEGEGCDGFVDPTTDDPTANGATTTAEPADPCIVGSVNCGDRCACASSSPNSGYTCQSEDPAWYVADTETDMQTCCTLEDYFSQRAFQRDLIRFTESSVVSTAPDGMTSVKVTFTGSNQFKPYWTVDLDNNQDTLYTGVGEIQNMETYCIDISNVLSNGVKCNLLSSTMEESITPRAGTGDSDTYINFPENFRALNWLHDTVSLGDNCGLSGALASHQVNGGDLQRATWMLIAKKEIVSVGAYSSYSGSKNECVHALVDRALAKQLEFDAQRHAGLGPWRPSRFSLVLLSPIACTSPLATIPNGQVLVGKYPVAPNDQKRVCADQAPDPCANAFCGQGTCSRGSVVGSLEQYTCTCDPGYVLNHGLFCQKA